MYVGPGPGELKFRNRTYIIGLFKRVLRRRSRTFDLKYTEISCEEFPKINIDHIGQTIVYNILYVNVDPDQAYRVIMIEAL